MTKSGDARMKPDRCQASTKTGKPCSATVVADGMCAWHAPSWAERRRQWSSRGGKGKSTQARAKKQIPAAMSATDLAGWLSLLFTGVLGGRIEPKIGTACATIARTLHEVRHTTELEERLSELEALAGLDTGRRRTG